MQRSPSQHDEARLKVAVIVPNWNGLAHLPTCLDALANQTFRPTETVLVDNGSTDGSTRLVRQQYPWVTVVELPTNVGFPAAVNTGIRSTTSPCVALLNNDTRPDPSWLDRLVHALESVPQADFAASKLLRFDSPHHIDSAGHGFSLTQCRGVDLGEGKPSTLFSQYAWVFGACAGAAIYRRSLFVDVGLFDEDFFFAYEDVDLDMRAQAAGHRCIYVPDAIAYHRRGGSHDSVAPTIRAIAIRNRLWVVGKSLPLPLLIVALASFALLALRELMTVLMDRALTLIWGRRTFPGRSGSFRVLVREVFRGIRDLPNKRRAARSYRRQGGTALLRAMQPQALI